MGLVRTAATTIVSLRHRLAVTNSGRAITLTRKDDSTWTRRRKISSAARGGQSVASYRRPILRHQEAVDRLADAGSAETVEIVVGLDPRLVQHVTVG